MTPSLFQFYIVKFLPVPVLLHLLLKKKKVIFFLCFLLLQFFLHIHNNFFLSTSSHILPFPSIFPLLILLIFLLASLHPVPILHKATLKSAFLSSPHKMPRQIGTNCRVESLTTAPAAAVMQCLQVLHCLQKGPVNNIFHSVAYIFSSESLASQIPSLILIDWAVLLGIHLLENLLFKNICSSNLPYRSLPQTLPSWERLIHLAFLSH